MTIEEAVQEIKDYIDAANTAMLSTINAKFETVKNNLISKIKSSSVIREEIKKVIPRKKRYQH